MPGSLDPPQLATINDPLNEPLFEVLGTNTPNDGRIAHGVVLLDPSTGAPYAATAGNASNTVAIHDTALPGQGAVVSADGALSVDSNHYGTPAAGAGVSVGTASTAVLGANLGRKLLILCNDSANTIYLDLSGAAAVLHKGVRLGANGGMVVLDRYVPTSAITAIATGAGSLLAIQEG